MDSAAEEPRRLGFLFPWREEADRISAFESPSSVLSEDVTESLESSKSFCKDNQQKLENLPGIVQ